MQQRQILYHGSLHKTKSGRHIRAYLMDDILLMLDEKERGRIIGFKIYKGVSCLLVHSILPGSPTRSVPSK